MKEGVRKEISLSNFSELIMIPIATIIDTSVNYQAIDFTYPFYISSVIKGVKRGVSLVQSPDLCPYVQKKSLPFFAFFHSFKQ